MKSRLAISAYVCKPLVEKSKKAFRCCGILLNFINMVIMNLLTTLFSGAALAVLALLLIRKTFEHRRTLALPPGPKPWPILGNVTDMPPKGQSEWKHWLKHMELYGPVSSVTALGKTIIVIHDKQSALELMEKRATTYSGRPSATFAMDMWV